MLCIDQIAKQLTQLNSVFSVQETALDKQSSLVDRFLQVQSKAEIALKEITQKTDADHVINESINDFNDWVSEQKLTFAALCEPDGSRDEMEKAMGQLNEMIETVFPVGDQKSARFEDEVKHEWDQLKRDVTDQLKLIKQNHADLIQFIDDIDAFDAWLKVKSGEINSDSAFKIDLLADGKACVLNSEIKKARPRFELGISSLLVRRFNQLSHRAAVLQLLSQI